jgi:hypothetical protein
MLGLGSGMNNRASPIATILLVLTLGACGYSVGSASVEQPGLPHRPVAVVRTTTLNWEGEQTYIPLYADGTASGLIVVNFDHGLLYGTGVPDSWTWLDKDTVEVCGSVNILRNEVGFGPMERDCAPHPIAGKQLDLDGDGEADLIETFEILDPRFYRERPSD